MQQPVFSLSIRLTVKSIDEGVVVRAVTVTLEAKDLPANESGRTAHKAALRRIVCAGIENLPFQLTGHRTSLNPLVLGAKY